MSRRRLRRRGLPVGGDAPHGRVIIADHAWRDADFDDRAPAGHRLAASLTINGTPMRVEAFLVVPGADPQCAYAGDDDLALIHCAVGADGPWPTTPIRGRRYVVVATPGD